MEAGAPGQHLPWSTQQMGQGAQRQQVALPPKALNPSAAGSADDGRMAALVAGAGVAEVDLDDGQGGDGADGIGDGEAAVGVGASVDDDAVDAAFDDPIDEDALVVALPTDDLEPELFATTDKAPVEGAKGLVSIDVWFAAAQQV